MSVDDRRRLRELARLHGVQTSYTSAAGRRVAAGDATLRGVLGALGVDASTPSQVARELLRPPTGIVEPVLVAWDGRLDDVPLTDPAAVGRHAAVRIEPVDADGVVRDARGEVHDGVLRLDRPDLDPLATGYHRLSISAGRRDASATVIAAPSRAPRPPAPLWGIGAPLHALRGPDDWGVGTYTDLGRLLAWIRARDGDAVATLPMFAAFLDVPFEPSPYSPASRLFWNELYIDVTAAPGFAESPEARAVLDDVGFRRDVEELRTSDLVDHRRAMALKRRVLEPLAERVLSGGAPPEIRRWLDERDGATDHARFRAEMDRIGAWWGAWEGRARDGTLTGDPLADPAGRYYVYAQWLADRQVDRLADTGAGRGLVLDLPLGVHGASYDVWRHREVFATGVSVGAPPDAFFRAGQDWGFPPIHPERVRDHGYAYPIACLRQLLRPASGIRVDHVMGLQRLYWIPDGMPPTAGAYVRAHADEWYAIITLESSRAGAIVVGEDLGTVPAEVRRAMARHDVHRTYVVQYEIRADDPVLPDPPARSIATVNTHDMVPWAAWVRGDDIDLAVELGVAEPDEVPPARARRHDAVVRLRDMMNERGLAADDGDDALLQAVLSYLAASEAALVIATVEDLWGARVPQNVPGTIDRPNWRVRFPYRLAQLDRHPGVDATLRRIAKERRRRTEREAGAA